MIPLIVKPVLFFSIDCFDGQERDLEENLKSGRSISFKQGSIECFFVGWVLP